MGETPKHHEAFANEDLMLESHKRLLAEKDALIAELTRERDEYRLAAAEGGQDHIDTLNRLQSAHERIEVLTAQRDEARQWDVENELEAVESQFSALQRAAREYMTALALAGNPDSFSFNEAAAHRKQLERAEQNLADLLK